MSEGETKSKYKRIKSDMDENCRGRGEDLESMNVCVKART